MEIDKNNVLKAVRNELTSEQFEESIIYWDREVLHEGQHIRIGPQTMAMPFDGMLVFVDLAPRFNWAHPCLYLLLNVKDMSIKVMEASFPPFPREIPETVAVIQRYGKEPPHDRYFKVFD